MIKSKQITQYYIVLTIIALCVCGFYYLQYLILFNSFGNSIAERMIEETYLKQEWVYNDIIFKDVENPLKMDMIAFGEQLKITYPLAIRELENPCQFYSHIWSTYLEYHNIEYNFETIPKHIFVIAYTNESYILLDQFVMTPIFYS